MRQLWQILIHRRGLLSGLFLIASTSILTAGLLLIRDRMEIATVALLYLLPVGASAAIGGLGPGILAAFLAFFSLNYFFLTPYGTLLVHQSQDILVLLVFLVLAVIISQLVGRMTTGLAAARARENETASLYELSQELSKLHQVPDILHILAVHTLDTFGCTLVEVSSDRGSSAIRIRRAEGFNPADLPVGEPDTVLAFQDQVDLQGGIRLWRSSQPLVPAEVRLLKTIVHQAALAVERSLLTEEARQAELSRAKEKLQASLLNSISHDLRTPLAGITGALSSLREQAMSLDSSSRQSLLDTAYEEALRLDRLLGNLLNMARIEAGAVRLRIETCDLQDVIGAALEQLGERSASREIQINLPGEVSLISLDSALFEQAIMNLLDNAVKYSDALSRIEIKVVQLPDAVQIEICDRGVGIPEIDLERIFDKFYRGTTPQRVSGTGLGLAISRGIVEAHGGTLGVERRMGGGSIFTINLPQSEAL